MRADAMKALYLCALWLYRSSHALLMYANLIIIIRLGVVTSVMGAQEMRGAKLNKLFVGLLVSSVVGSLSANVNVGKCSKIAGGLWTSEEDLP